MQEDNRKNLIGKRPVATMAKGVIIICESRGNKLKKRRAVDAIDPRIQVYID
jgi:lactate dehydrogenase-like 2-hydroxyacid dehydrogenase